MEPLDVHYVKGGDNSLLKSALFAAYKTRCYLCRKPDEFKNMTIDHIVPQGLKGEHELSMTLEYLGLPVDMNLDDPANLALSCMACNRDKSDRTFNSDAYMVKIDNAIKLRNRVVEHCRSLTQGNDAVKAVNGVVQIDLGEPRARGALIDFAPALVQKIATLLGQPLEYSLDYWIEFSVGFHQVQRSRVSLDVNSRSALETASRASGLSHADILQNYSLKAIAHFRDEFNSEFYPESPEGANDTLSAYSIERVEYVDLALSIEFDSSDLLLRARSELEVDVARSLTRGFPSGDTADYQVEGTCELSYQSAYRWDLEEGAGDWSDEEEASMRIFSIDLSPN